MNILRDLYAVIEHAGTDYDLPNVPLDEGYIPGWSVLLPGASAFGTRPRVLGRGLSEQTALTLCANHLGSEIWGYGRTMQTNWPHAERKSVCLVRNDEGILRKTAEYPL